ncbi:hypothetical protein BU15DRAFT_58451 [Melanogaster broomeanus]|nr:hypothetical protein BU15DRAFT_58451 [Melanogaster broomeanus]
MFAAMREDSEKFARDTNAYATFQNMKGQARMNKDKFEDHMSTYSSLLEDLVPWRMQVVQAGQEMTQAQSTRLRKSRKQMLNAAKRDLDEAREKQRLVADASDFIKHYKALILAT